MVQMHCRHFNGYKPCGLAGTCESSCAHFERMGSKILVIHLEALGAVLRSTSLLPAIHRDHPGAYVVWLTKGPAREFFVNHPLVDVALTISAEDLCDLKSREFDFVYVIDKSPVSAALAESIRSIRKYGFGFDRKNFSVVPYNSEATELWNIGLDNGLKFYRNQKPETQLVAESLGLSYQRDEYQVFLSPAERAESRRRHKLWSQNQSHLVVGINTGCSPTLANKKLSLQVHIQLIEMLLMTRPWHIVLLGGKEDSERNKILANLFPHVVLSPTANGIRDGLVSVEACDMVFTGDSLGMHMGIALKKWVVAWFGPTCAHEIDFYGRGKAILSQAKCSPCWRRSCQEPVMCYDQVDLRQVLTAMDEGEAWQRNQSWLFKQHSLEICS